MERLGLGLLDCRCRFLTTLFLLFASLVFNSCSSNGSSPLEDGGESNYAPESVSMKNFRFYKGNQDMWSFEVYFGNEVSLITSSNYFVVDDCDAIYEKTGENTAHFWSYYTAYAFIGGNQIGVYTEHDLQLTFLSAHHGRFTGKVSSKPDSSGESISGMFVYNSDKGLDSFVNQENQDEKQEINVSNLTKNSWIDTDTSCKRFFSFDEEYDCRHYFEYQGYVVEEEGEYVFDEKKNILKILGNTGETIFDFKVFKLSQSEMWLGVYDPSGKKYPSSPTMKLRTTTQNDEIPSFINAPKVNFIISTPAIQNITTNSAQVSGTINITGDGKSAEMGLCYSKNETPTINDYKVKSSSSQISIDLNNLEVNTTYNVRLYVIYKGEVQYGKIISFKTKEVPPVNEEEFYVDIRSINYNSSSDNNFVSLKIGYIDGDEDVKKKTVGFCYGTNPNPTITDFTTSLKSVSSLSSAYGSIGGLNAGTVYYIRPYTIKDGKAIYYKEYSFETIGKNMKLSVDVFADENKGVAQYEINMEGTYKLDVKFWDTGTGRYNVIHIGYVEKTKGSFDFEVPDYYWDLYEQYEVRATCVETGISYECLRNL